MFHLLELVRSGPITVQTARSFFERKILPLANAGWRARGGEYFDFVTGHGNTILDDVRMRQFVSEQVYAMRRYSGAHGRRAPAGRLGVPGSHATGSRRPSRRVALRMLRSAPRWT